MRARGGMTLVELLVVIAIIGMLVGVLLPAVHAARESGRLVTCKNHLRQQAIALRSYAQQYSESLPALWRTQNPQPWQNFSWRVELLPFLEEDNRYEQLHKDLWPLDEANLPLVGTLEIFNCPSSPGFPRIIHSLGFGSEAVEGMALGATDYAPVFDVRPAFESIGQSGTWYGGVAPDTMLVSDGMREVDSPMIQVDMFNARIRTVPSTLLRVRDGLSNTALLVEQAGKPLRYQRVETEQAPTEGAWATAEYASFYAGGVNQDNHAGPYGFHNGASIVMCDASVHFWSPAIDQQVMIALLTREGSEILSDADWQ